MDIYVAIVESTDNDRNGYGFDQIVGCFDNEEAAYETARSSYMDLIQKVDEDHWDDIIGYRVDIYKLGSKEPPIAGLTHWMNQDGTEDEMKMH